jgi:hypothetical protein
MRQSPTTAGTLTPEPAAEAAVGGAAAGPRSDWIRAAVLSLGSAVLFLFSNSVQYGDAATYAKQITAGALLEPGHLLWRPLGYLAAALIGVGSNSGVLWVLQAASLLFSALAVGALYLVLRRAAGCTPSAAGVAAGLLAVSNGFWTYSFSGCSYSLSVLLLIAAMGAATCTARPAAAKRALLAGILAGAAVSAWATQVLSLPALLLLLVMSVPWQQAQWRLHLRNALALAGGVMLSFLLPLLAAYAWHLAHQPPPPGAAAGFGAWTASAAHGVAPQFSPAQVLRVAIGWPQSLLSMFDLGQRLRLWSLHEASFPWSVWMLSPLVVYALAACCAYRLLRGFRRQPRFAQAMIIASAVAIAANLLFALLWQGTDLERYFPSLPFQMLLVALTLSGITIGRAAAAMLVVALGCIAWVNWRAAFLTVLSSDSHRQVWLRELHRAAHGGDLLVVLGQSKLTVTAPHDAYMPRIDNLSLEVRLRGTGWKAAVLQDMATTVQHGGRVFLGDSLFDAEVARRDGWSFREYPSLSPQQIQAVFLPFKSDTVAFTAGGERVWLAQGTATADPQGRTPPPAAIR